MKIKSRTVDDRDVLILAISYLTRSNLGRFVVVLEDKDGRHFSILYSDEEGDAKRMLAKAIEGLGGKG